MQAASTCLRTYWAMRSYCEFDADGELVGAGEICDWEDILPACEVTDPENVSQWRADLACDPNHPCSEVAQPCQKSLGGLFLLCSYSEDGTLLGVLAPPEPEPETCDWATIMPACGVSDVFDKSQWDPELGCAPGHPCAEAVAPCTTSLAELLVWCAYDEDGKLLGPSWLVDGEPEDGEECDWSAPRAACGFDIRMPAVWDLGVLCDSASECAQAAAACPSITAALESPRLCEIHAALSSECASSAEHLAQMSVTHGFGLYPPQLSDTASTTCSETCIAEGSTITGDPAFMRSTCCGVKWISMGCGSYEYPAAKSLSPSDVLLAPVSMSCDTVSGFEADKSAAELPQECAALLADPACEPTWGAWAAGATDTVDYGPACSARTCAANVLDTCLTQAVLDKLFAYMDSPQQRSGLEEKLLALQALNTDMLVEEVCPVMSTPECVAAMSGCQEMSRLAEVLLPVEFGFRCLDRGAAADDSTPAPTSAPTPAAPTPAPTPAATSAPTSAPLVLALDTEMKVLTAVATLADLTVDSFGEAERLVFRGSIANEVDVPLEWVTILVVNSGSVVVNWSVAVVAADEAKLADLEEALQNPEEVFDPSLGAVEVAKGTVTTLTYQDVVHGDPAQSAAMHAKPAAILYALLALVSAAFLAVNN